MVISGNSFTWSQARLNNPMAEEPPFLRTVTLALVMSDLGRYITEGRCMVSVPTTNKTQGELA